MYLDIKYISMIGNRYRNFKKKSNNLYNYSCPLCGDSQKDLKKARGYFYKYKGEMWSKCWNCNVAMSFKNFLKDQDPRLYEEYMLEKFKGSRRNNKDNKEDAVSSVINKTPPKFNNVGVLEGLIPVSALAKDHPVRKYVEDRKIPESYYSDLFLVPKFMAWVNKLLPKKFEAGALKYDSPRLVIPFFDKEKNVHTFTGRSFDPKDGRKYIQIKLEDDALKIFGMDRVDVRKRVYIFEGPINSMFIDNAVACGGISDLGESFTDRVYVLDHDRRNKHVGNSIKKLIDKGEKVCLFDDEVPTGYDVNDLINDLNWTPERVKEKIDNCTYDGLAAHLKFEEWRKY